MNMNMIRIFRNALLGAGLLLLLTRMPADAQQAARVALVIGNAGYTDAPDLPQAKNDAQAMAQTLKQLGFQVILALDADKRGMDEAVKRFGKQIENGGIALFYYSGHGLQAEDGLNYLVPLASGITKPADIPYQAVSANWVLASMEEWNERGVNLMILDACRNPLKVKGGAEGLAPMEVTGSLVAYATAANQRARIEPGATFSVYTKHLLNVLQTNPCQKIRDLFAEVADSVALSGSGQQPYIVQSPLVGRFQFAECAAPTPEPRPTIEPTATPTPESTATPTPKPTATPQVEETATPLPLSIPSYPKGNYNVFTTVPILDSQLPPIRVAMKRIGVSLIEQKSAKQPMQAYKVSLGYFPEQQQTAEWGRNYLRPQGIEYKVFNVNDMYSLQLGVFSNQTSVDKKIEQLRQAFPGWRLPIRTELTTIMKPTYRLSARGTTEKVARSIQKELGRLGIPAELTGK